MSNVSEWKWCEPGTDITHMMRVIRKGSGDYKITVNTHGVVRNRADGGIEFRPTQWPLHDGHPPAIHFDTSGCQGYVWAGITFGMTADGKSFGSINHNVIDQGANPLPDSLRGHDSVIREESTIVTWADSYPGEITWFGQVRGGERRDELVFECFHFDGQHMHIDPQLGLFVAVYRELGRKINEYVKNQSKMPKPALPPSCGNWLR